MKNYSSKYFPGIAVTALIILCSSCTIVPKTHLGDMAIVDERIELKNTEEKKIWSTDDLSVHYALLDRGDFIDLNGFVEISTSVTYTFPLTDYLYIYVYLLDGEGIAASRHRIHPNISKFNTFPERGDFSATLPKDPGTVSIAFGYAGNFVSIEREEGGRMRGYEKIDWQIYHDPFL